MKRREFLLASAGVAGAALPGIGLAATRPCPPPTINEGNASATTLCAGGNALSDWNARSTGAGVLWALRFADETNVYKFSSAPAKSSNVTAAERAAAQQIVRYKSNDGIIGDGCMEHFYPAGAGTFLSWSRPLAPLPGDINNAGVPTVPDVNPYYWPSGPNNLRTGFFAHDDYVGPYVPNARWPSPQIIGNEFWLQFRIKFSASSFTDTTAKVMWLNVNSVNTNQQLFWDMMTNYTQGHTQYSSAGPGAFEAFTNYGNAWNSSLTDVQGDGSGSKLQAGGAFQETCRRSTTQQGYPATNCWTFIPDQWVTLMFHIKPGHNAEPVHVANPTAHAPDAVFNGYRDTIAECFAARPGATTWTKVWGRNDWVWSYFSQNSAAGSNIWSSQDSSTVPYGFNWLQLSNFNGGLNTTPVVADVYRRFDQMICSTQPIACPTV